MLFYPQDYGVGEDAFCEWYFDGADVEVAGVDVQGDSATVHVAFSAKRMAEVLPILEQARDQALADGADAMRDGYANERFAAVVENAQVGTDRLEIAVPVTRGSDGTWAIDEPAHVGRRCSATTRARSPSTSLRSKLSATKQGE